MARWWLNVGCQLRSGIGGWSCVAPARPIKGRHGERVASPHTTPTLCLSSGVDLPVTAPADKTATQLPAAAPECARNSATRNCPQPVRIVPPTAPANGAPETPAAHGARGSCMVLARLPSGSGPAPAAATTSPATRAQTHAVAAATRAVGCVNPRSEAQAISASPPGAQSRPPAIARVGPLAAIRHDQAADQKTPAAAACVSVPPDQPSGLGDAARCPHEARGAFILDAVVTAGGPRDTNARSAMLAAIRGRGQAAKPSSTTSDAATLAPPASAQPSGPAPRDTNARSAMLAAIRGRGQAAKPSNKTSDAATRAPPASAQSSGPAPRDTNARSAMLASIRGRGQATKPMLAPPASDQPSNTTARSAMLAAIRSRGQPGSPAVAAADERTTNVAFVPVSAETAKRSDPSPTPARPNPTVESKAQAKPALQCDPRYSKVSLAFTARMVMPVNPMV